MPGNRLPETWYATASDAALQVNSTRSIAYGYDLAGRLRQAGSNTFAYDDLDRVTRQDANYGSVQTTLRTTYGTRQDGLRDTLALEVNGTRDFINDYDYDARLWLTSVTQTSQMPVPGEPTPRAVATKRVEFDHAGDGRLEHLRRYADVAETKFVAQTDFGYDQQNRLNGITHVQPVGTGHSTQTALASYTWDYDDAGRIWHLGSPNGQVIYGYDDRGQLTGADYEGANQPADKVYLYDQNGNRDDANFDINDHNLAQTDGTFSYLYDEEGNRTHKARLGTSEYETYTWDNRNRLEEVKHFSAPEVEAWRVEYQYDYANRLTRRLETQAGQTPVTRMFVYDGEQIILETDETGKVTHRYLWGESVDQILADESVDLVTQIGQTRWTLTDHLNTVRDIATFDSENSDTSIVDHIIYEAFGKVTSETSPANSTSFKFTGRYTDPLSGLQWNLNRWYDSSLHQWLSIDPILFEAGDPNPRRYVGNDPVNRVDPSGLEEGSWAKWAMGVTKAYSGGIYASTSQWKEQVASIRNSQQDSMVPRVMEARRSVVKDILGERPKRSEFWKNRLYDGAEMIASSPANREESGYQQFEWSTRMADGALSSARQFFKNGMYLDAEGNQLSWIREDNIAFVTSAAEHSTPTSMTAYGERLRVDFAAWANGRDISDAELEMSEQNDPQNRGIMLQSLLRSQSQWYAATGHEQAVADGAAAIPFIEWAGATIVDIAITVGTLGAYALEGATIRQMVGHIGREFAERISPVPLTLNTPINGAAKLEWKFALNQGRSLRSTDEAVALAKRYGVEIGDDIRVISRRKLELSNSGNRAEYFYLGGRVSHGTVFSWNDLLVDGKLPVRVRRVVFASDEAIVATLGHEMHEINVLRSLFIENGTITAERLRELINSPNGVLHREALQIESDLLKRMRGN